MGMKPLSKLMKHWRGATSLTSVALIGVVSYIGYQDMNDNAMHSAPDSDLTVAVDDVENQAFAPLRIDISVTQDMSVISENTTLKELCENAPENKKYFCDLALELQNATGIDGFVLLATLGMETMFNRQFAINATHEAQGVWQIQPPYLVTELRRHGKNLPFYSDLQDEDPLKLAIDRLVREQNDPVALARYNAQLALDEFDDPLEEALNKLIYDDFRTGQLVSAVYLNQTPEAHHDNFTGTWREDFNARINATLNLYSYHKMGPNGLRYQMAVMNDPDARLITPRDTEQMAEILQKIQIDNGWTPLSVADNRQNAMSNPAVFASLDNTLYACVLPNMESAIKSHMGDFIPFPENPIPVQNWLDIYCGQQSQYAVYTSIKPVARPDGLSTSIVNNDTSESKRVLRPRARPDIRTASLEH